MAERVGFEPTKGYKPLLVFKTSAFNRSATSPLLRNCVSIPCTMACRCAGALCFDESPDSTRGH